MADKLFGKFGVKLDKENPIIETNVAADHVVLDDSIESVFGEIEPLVGLEWSEKGAGKSVSRPVVCLSPGTVIGGEKLNLEVGNFGLLQLEK